MADKFTARARAFLFHASRSRGFLWKFALGVLLGGVVLGYLLSRSREIPSASFSERVLAHAGLSVLDDEEKWEAPDETAPRLLEAFHQQLSDRSAPDFEHLLLGMPDFAPFVAASDFSAIQEELRTHFGEGPAHLAIDYLAATNLADQAAHTRLRRQADDHPPGFLAWQAVGENEMRRKNYREAYAAFRRAGLAPDGLFARYRAVQALLKEKDYDAVEALRTDPAFADCFTLYVERDLAAGRHDWLKLARAVFVSELTFFDRHATVVSIVTALAWGLFLFHLGEVRCWADAGLCVLGFAAGLLSVTPTVFLVIVQEDVFALSPGENIYHAFAYNIAGVGLREELCKLVLFAPLLPFLIRRRDDLLALTAACFVGLGFAVAENGNYFLLSQAASAPGRFLTANFFHIALTGLNGIALYRGVTRGLAGLNELLLIFPVTVLAHGAYDALLDAQEIEAGSYFAMIVYVGFSYYFFQRTREIREQVRLTLSLTGAFVFGISTLGATVIAFQMATLGPAAAGNLIFSEFLGSILLLIMFFRQFDEALSA